jgi:hypothetical protein
VKTPTAQRLRQRFGSKIVEEPLGRVVLPTLAGLKHAVIEASQKRSGIDGGDLDPELLQFEFIVSAMASTACLDAA